MPKLTAAEEKQLRSQKEMADKGYAAWTNENMLDILDTLDAERARVAELEKGLRDIREAIEANEAGSGSALGIVVVCTVNGLLRKEGKEDEV